MPERFELEYTAEDGTKQRPVMIHRAILGSFERFITVLLEHYNGNLPMWLSPVQVAILPITEEIQEYAKEIAASLEKEGVRFVMDDSSKTIGKKIRNASSQKVPVLMIIGKKEMAEGTVSLRSKLFDEEPLPIADAIRAMAEKSTPN
jgi:threonyl-tRNA synthetase